MTVESITRTRAAAITGMRLPYGMRWYVMRGVQFYPTYGHWSFVTAGDDGLSVVIGKQKAAIAKDKAA
jgi:hypothetical protein